MNLLIEKFAAGRPSAIAAMRGANELAPPHLDGTYHRATVGAAPLCGVRL